MAAHFEELRSRYVEMSGKYQANEAALRKDIEALRRKLQTETAERAAAMQDNDRLRRFLAEAQELGRVHREKLEDERRAREELQHANEEKDRYRLTCGSLERRNQDLEEKLQENRQLASMAVEERDKDWETKLKLVESEKEDLMIRLRDRSQDEQVKALKQQNRELEARLDEMVKDLHSVRGRAASKLQGGQETARQLRAVTQRCREQEKEADRERERAKQLQAVYEEEKLEVQRLHVQCLGLEARCVQAREDAEAAEDRLSQQRLAQQTDLGAVQREHAAAVEELEHERARLRDQVCELRADMEQQQLRQQTTEQRLRQESGEALREEADRRRQLEARVQELNAERGRTTEKHEREKAALRSEVAALRQEADALRLQRKQVEGDREKLQLQVTTLAQENQWRGDEMERFQLEWTKHQDREARLKEAEEGRQLAEDQVQLLQVHLKGSQQQLQALRQEAQRELAAQRDRQERALVARDQQLDEERQGFGYTIQTLHSQLKHAKGKHRRGRDRWMEQLAEQIKRCEELSARCERLEEESDALRRFRSVVDDAAAAAVLPPRVGSDAQADPAPAADAGALWQRNMEKVAALERSLAQHSHPTGRPPVP
eukprot:TRINITY_DN7601_c0_g1_i1.p1 TRINITY_DN7601_c0_g1~~TRINITY_DN7601_c0_g1_i1.p1  ORF type:complete len:637 (+),score=365.38 TRINITY_DN7601_c0_g1_i1:94-1911(+)